MLDHDKEPWVAHGATVYFGHPKGGFDVGDCPNGAEKAQRIVKCVNACRGLPNKDLDLIQTTTLGMVGYVKQRDEAIKQRDAILETLKLLLEYTQEMAEGHKPDGLIEHINLTENLISEFGSK